MFAFRRSRNTLYIHENRKRIDPDWLSFLLRFIWKFSHSKAFRHLLVFSLSLSPYWGFEKTSLMWLNWKIMNQTMPAIIHVNWSKLLCTRGAVSIRILQKIYSLRRDVVFSSMTNFRDIQNSGILINADYQLFGSFPLLMIEIRESSKSQQRT